MGRPIAWYDPSNGVVSTDKDCPLFTPLGQVWALYPQPEQEPDCYGYAARLATSIWKQHYQKTAPQWEVLDNLIGVLTQIDNMVAGLISPPMPEQPEQEPVAWAAREDFYLALDRRVERMRKEMEIKTVTMRCKDYDVALPIIDMRFGHVFVGQVSTTSKPPQSSMAWQEGCEVGRLAERDACAKICDHMASRCNDIRAAALESAAENIRARGNT